LTNIGKHWQTLSLHERRINCLQQKNNKHSKRYGVSNLPVQVVEDYARALKMHKKYETAADMFAAAESLNNKLNFAHDIGYYYVLERKTT
jgi:hypothetical protein